MPIYAYRCASCGFANDHLQKLSDPALENCPACGQATYVKQLTAAGFQLKGSGWYVTDFKGGQKQPSSKETPAASEATAAAGDGAPAADKAATPAPKATSTDGANACAGN